MSFGSTILFALWFFAPAGAANASPVFAAKLPGLRKFNTPIDLGKTYRGKPIFGSNKTWRGLVLGIVVATLVVGLEHYLHHKSAHVRSFFPVDYCKSSILWLGPLLGFGALAGDTIESFFKRQVGVKPGKSWFPFDQVDYIVGGLLASLLLVRLNLAQYLAVVLVWFVIHLVGSYVGYLLKLKDRPI